MTGSLPYNVWPKVVLRTGLFARCKETSEFVASGEGVALTPIFAKVEQPLKAAFATNDLRRICGAIDVAVPGYFLLKMRRSTEQPSIARSASKTDQRWIQWSEFCTFRDFV
jgi:hypothetical protein